MQKLYMIILLIALIALAAVSSAQEVEPSRSLVVATKPTAPFAMKLDDTGWTGISIELWERIAAELGYEYEYVETDLMGMVEGLADGRFDVGVAALTLSPEREQVIDYTYPFYRTGLTIATQQEGAGLWRMLQAFVSWRFIEVVATLIVVLFVVGVLVWFFERRHNPDQFGGTAAQGVGSGFWWSAVTMTTVGYGDKAPRTVGGRVVALIWMFTAIIIISSFTGAIASVVTVTQLQSPVQSLRDLYQARVVTVEGSIAADYLTTRGISHRTTANITEAIERLADGHIDAVVYDAPILRFLINRDYPSELVVLDMSFRRQDYGFGLPEGAPWREPVNRALLNVLETPTWREVMERYLGPEE